MNAQLKPRTSGLLIGAAAVGVIGLGLTAVATGVIAPFDPAADPPRSQPPSEESRPPAPNIQTDRDDPVALPRVAPVAPPTPPTGPGAGSPGVPADDGTENTGNADDADDTDLAAAPAPAAPDAAPPPRAIDQVVYTFDLPLAEENVNERDFAAYTALQLGCAGGEDYMLGIMQVEPGVGEFQFRGPRFAVLYMAGIALCKADVAAGRALSERAIADYGTAGLGPDVRPECKLYRTVRSVVEQQPQLAYTCPDGEVPDWVRVEDAQGNFVGIVNPIYDEMLALAKERGGPLPPDPVVPPQTVAQATPAAPVQAGADVTALAPASGERVGAEPVAADQVAADVVEVETTAADTVAIEPVTAEPVETEPVESEPATTEPATAEAVAVDEVEAAASTTPAEPTAATSVGEEASP